MMKLLLAAHADTTVVSKSKATAYEFADENGHKEIAALWMNNMKRARPPRVDSHHCLSWLLTSHTVLEVSLQNPMSKIWRIFMKGYTLKVTEDATDRRFEVRVDESGEPTQIYASNAKESRYFPNCATHIRQAVIDRRWNPGLVVVSVGIHALLFSMVMRKIG